MFYKFRDRLHFAAIEVRERFRRAQVLSETNPAFAATQVRRPGLPVIDIFMKDMFDVADVEGIFKYIIPNLQHENDGLIFTMNACPYYPGTCQEIMKWKPTELNTVDFELKPLPSSVNCKNIWGLYSFGVDKRGPYDEGRKYSILFDLMFLKSEEEIA